MTHKTKSLALAPLETSFDQPASLPRLKVVLEKIDQIMAQAVEQKKPKLAFDLIEQLSQMTRLSGLGLAKALWMFRDSWEVLGQGMEDNFETAMFKRFGKAPDTLRRYLKAWDVFAKMPKEVPAPVVRELLQRPVQDHIAIGQYRDEHGLAARRYAELAQAPDTASVRKLLRRYRGEPENEWLRYRVEEDGTFWAYEGGEQVVLGFLRITAEDRQHPLRARALARLSRKLSLEEIP